jgi:hypothetical protein
VLQIMHLQHCLPFCPEYAYEQSKKDCVSFSCFVSPNGYVYKKFPPETPIYPGY